MLISKYFKNKRKCEMMLVEKKKRQQILLQNGFLEPNKKKF